MDKTTRTAIEKATQRARKLLEADFAGCLHRFPLSPGFTWRTSPDTCSRSRSSVKRVMDELRREERVHPVGTK